MLIEVAVISVPTQTELLEGGVERVLVPPTAVVANDSQGAILKIGVANADKLKDEKLERAKILVRTMG